MSMQKKLISTMLGLALAATYPAYAVEEHHPDRAATTPRLLDNAKKLQSQASRIAKAKTPAERERLLQEHLRTMQEGMMLTRNMMAAPQGGPQAGGMMGGMSGGGMMQGCPMMQGGMMGGQGMTGGPMMMDGLPGIDVSDEQRKRINAIHDSVRKQQWDLSGKLMDEQARLRDLYSAEKRDPAAIGAQYQRIFDLRRQQIEASIAAHNQVEEALTPEQRKALRESCRRGHMGGGMMGGPGMMGR
ncbi:MAG: Spy/CpxP family protein refolding chaperone [Pseudomonadota bacterium]|jgi:Spy/CpxP family protein refolding chaperone